MNPENNQWLENSLNQIALAEDMADLKLISQILDNEVTDLDRQGKTPASHPDLLRIMNHINDKAGVFWRQESPGSKIFPLRD